MHVHLRNQSQGGERKGDVRQDEKVDRGRSGQSEAVWLGQLLCKGEGGEANPNTQPSDH